MKTNEAPVTEPYRYFFLSGWMISVLGVSIWIFYQLNWFSTYPQNSHANIMILGFLCAYVFGFLMTAVPRMSQTAAANSAEIYTGLALIWLQFLSNYFLPGNISYVMAVLQFVFILFFILRRMAIKQSQPPAGFVFVLTGLLAGLTGSIVMLLPPEYLGAEAFQLGKSFLYQAFILNLILGLGSRLIPMLSRVEGAIDIRTSSTETKLYYLVLAVLLNGAFLVEAFVSAPAGNLLKFAIVFFVAFKKFKIFSKKSVSGNLGSGLRAAVMMLAAGFLLAGIFSAYAIHFIHITFIGGFSMLTILISTRVVLAHGHYDLTTELVDSHLLWFVGVFLTLAIGRAAAGFYSSERALFHFILFFGWCAGCLIWGKAYLPKLLKTNEGI